MKKLELRLDDEVAENTLLHLHMTKLENDNAKLWGDNAKLLGDNGDMRTELKEIKVIVKTLQCGRVAHIDPFRLLRNGVTR